MKAKDYKKHLFLAFCILCVAAMSSVVRAEAVASDVNTEVAPELAVDKNLDETNLPSTQPSSETLQLEGNNISSPSENSLDDQMLDRLDSEIIPNPDNVNGDMTSLEGTEAPSQEKKGLPQLKIDTFASQIFWLLVSFILMYITMSKMALPKMARILSIREMTRTNNLERAKELSDSAEKLRDTYERELRLAHDKAQTLITKTEQAMTQETTARQAEFLENTKQRIADAEIKIKQAKDEALKSLHDVATDATIETVKRITGITITKMDAQKYVSTSAKETG